MCLFKINKSDIFSFYDLFLLWEAANLAASSSDLSPSCTTILSVRPIPRFTSTNKRGTGSSRIKTKNPIFIQSKPRKYPLLLSINSMIIPLKKITFLTCRCCFCLSISQKRFWIFLLVSLLIYILLHFWDITAIPLALWRREKWLWCWLWMLFCLFLCLFSIILH